MERVYGAAIPALESQLRFRLARQGALAANVAHADTPGYRRVELRFDQSLDRELGRLVTTHPRHASSAGSERYRVERGPEGTRPDRNGVDRDQEVLALSRNAGAFTKVANVLSRIYAMRRIAATGELG